MHANTRTHADRPTYLLIPGHWLGAWAFDEVVAHLTQQGHHAVALTLPGLDPTDPDRLARTLAEQAAAIETAITATGGPVIIVAHSGANAPVSLALDQHPDRIRRVIWVDSGPVASGSSFAADLPAATDALPLPTFDTLSQQASTAGLSPTQLAHFRKRAVSQPTSLLRDTVTLTNHARFAVPTTFVCCSYPSAQVHKLVAAAHPMFAEVAHYAHVDYVDLPTGHWPMWSEPARLAELLAARG